MHDPHLLERLSRVHTPTLVLWGEKDPIVSPGWGGAYADAFPVCGDQSLRPTHLLEGPEKSRFAPL
jgi:pimeloyl-ACP methyl ester carboxylesterase